jgi:hypothetical protein
MIFVDWLTVSQRQKDARNLAGMRVLTYREPGDINREGVAVDATDVIKDSASWAWVKGSHGTSIRVISHNGTVALSGNPGRWGRPDNLFNLDLFDTVKAANVIVEGQGLPYFSVGEPVCGGVEVDSEIRWSGARLWGVHLTQNYVTGSPENAAAVIEWLNTQSVARVKKGRFGNSTVTWGSLKYCQTEAYIKADEMLAHAKGDDAKVAVQASDQFRWAKENGIVRVEVKAAKDFLRHKGLTYLGAWDMGTVTRLFDEKTEVLNRLRLDVEDFELASIPATYRMTAAAWLRGEDVSVLFNNRMSLYRHAKALRAYGIDIQCRRNLATMPVRVRTITMQPVAAPDWYSYKTA